MDNRKLIEKVARKLGRDKGDVTKLLEAFTSIVTTRCSELDSIAIPGFGTFEPRKRNERIITNPANGKSVQVKVTDRGPHHKSLVIDLSRKAAEQLDIIRQGTAKVVIEVLRGQHEDEQ